MDSTFSKFTARATTTSSDIVFPVLGLLLVGLLANLSSREEIYANPEYGFSVLALFGAAGYIGYLAASIPRRSEVWAFYRSATGVVPAASFVPGAGGPAGWPVLVALLLGPLVFLFSGLGGWV